MFCKYDPEQETASIRHKCGASTSPVSGNVPYGQGTWALASGRKAGRATGRCRGAYMGMDINGPTAAVRSYGKIDNNTISGGSTINMYIQRENLATPRLRRRCWHSCVGRLHWGSNTSNLTSWTKMFWRTPKKPGKVPHADGSGLRVQRLLCGT